MKKTEGLSVCLAFVASLVLAAEPVDVPELMRTFDGREVKDLATWEKVRKPELKRYFIENMFGVRPPTAEKPEVAFEPAAPDKVMPGGKVVRKMMRITCHGPYGDLSFVATAFIPDSRSPVPSFLLISGRNPEKDLDPEQKIRSGFWPVEEIVGRGYAAIAFFHGDIAPDNGNPETAHLTGVFPCYELATNRNDSSWATLSAWAWGASRVMDWIGTEPLLDEKRVAVVGQSRGGKTALLAGVTDERFAMICANDSGNAGAKLSSIDLPLSQFYAEYAVSRFTYWFCGNFWKCFANRDRRIDKAEEFHAWHPASKRLEVDQHEWIALLAPRLVAVASATDDPWAGPEGEFHAARLASPAWELYGEKGLCASRFPQPMQHLKDGCVSYHLREGKHALTPYDWRCYMDFADKHGWNSSSSTTNDR